MARPVKKKPAKHTGNPDFERPAHFGGGSWGKQGGPGRTSMPENAGKIKEKGKDKL